MPGRRRKPGNPFRGVVDIVSEMNRMADRMASTDSSVAQPPRSHSDAWSPSTDILADGSNLIIRCELAGVLREDVEVSLSQGTLTIYGERRRGSEGDDQFYVQERYYGRFRRAITLPEGVTEEDIDAQITEGVLQVTVKGAATASGPAVITVRGG